MAVVPKDKMVDRSQPDQWVSVGTQSGMVIGVSMELSDEEVLSKVNYHRSRLYLKPLDKCPERMINMHKQSINQIQTY